MSRNRKYSGNFTWVRGQHNSLSSTQRTLGEDELPDLVMPSEQRRSDVDLLSSVCDNTDVTVKQGKTGNAEVPIDHCTRYKAQSRGLEIKQRKRGINVSNSPAKRAKMSVEPSRNSPELIDMTGDDSPVRFQAEPEGEDQKLVIDLDGLDELSEGYDRKIIPDFLAKAIFADTRSSALNPPDDGHSSLDQFQEMSKCCSPKKF